MFGAVFRAASYVGSRLKTSLTPALSNMFVRGMANQRHKKILKLAKGYRNRRNRCYGMAKRAVDRARRFSFIGRKVRKREFRKLWIIRVNAGSRMYGMSYNTLVHSMWKNNIHLNRKVLSDLAVSEPLSFRSVMEVVKQPC